MLLKTDGSASSGVTAQQGMLVPARAEVAAAPAKSHPRVAMWCARCAHFPMAFVHPNGHKLPSIMLRCCPVICMKRLCITRE